MCYDDAAGAGTHGYALTYLTSATFDRSVVSQKALLYALDSAAEGRANSNAWSARPFFFASWAIAARLVPRSRKSAGRESRRSASSWSAYCRTPEHDHLRPDLAIMDDLSRSGQARSFDFMRDSVQKL